LPLPKPKTKVVFLCGGLTPTPPRSARTLDLQSYLFCRATRSKRASCPTDLSDTSLCLQMLKNKTISALLTPQFLSARFCLWRVSKLNATKVDVLLGTQSGIQQDGKLEYYQNVYATYDGRGRVSNIQDSASDKLNVSYQYDLNNNRKHIYQQAGGSVSVNDWYTYDELGRAVISKGYLGNNEDSGQVEITYSATKSKVTSYDASGRRLSVQGPNGLEEYKYDDFGNLTETWVDGTKRSERTVTENGTVQRTQEWVVYGSGTQLSRDESYEYNDKGLRTKVTNNLKSNAYQNFNFDDNGVLQTADFHGPESGDNYSMAYSYEKWDSAKETQVATALNKQSGLQRTRYDENGNIKYKVDALSNNRIDYQYNSQGQVLNRTEVVTAPDGTESSREHHYYYFNGNQIGEAGSGASGQIDYAQQSEVNAFNYTETKNQEKAIADDESYTTKEYDRGSSINFDPTLQHVDPNSSPSGYTTRQGDTLQSIALSMYGDSSLWYIIADANGLQAGVAIGEGLNLSIPAQILGLSHKADSFAPYNAGATLGNLDTETSAVARRISNPLERSEEILITITIEVVALVAGAYGGALGYALAKQVGNNIAGRQGDEWELDSWDWEAFTYDAVVFAATPGGSGGWQQAAATTITRASIDHVAYDLTDGRQGQSWNWRRMGTQAFVNAGLSYGLEELDLKVDNVAGKVALQYGSNVVSVVATDELARNFYSDSEYRDYKENNHGNVFKRAGESTAAGLYSDFVKDQLSFSSEALQKQKEQDPVSQGINYAIGAVSSGVSYAVGNAAGWVSEAWDSASDSISDAWDDLTGPADNLALTNMSALSQQQNQDRNMMDAERQLASSMNPQTQSAVNRDQALIYGNYAEVNEFGDTVSQSMSTDVDRNAQLGVMDGLVNVAPTKVMTQVEVAALGDVPDMVAVDLVNPNGMAIEDGMRAVPDIDRISQTGLQNQIDGMSPVSLDGANKQSRFERMAEVAYDQSPELQEQLGRIIPQLQGSQDRINAMPTEVPWQSKLPVEKDRSIDVLDSIVTGGLQVADYVSDGVINAADNVVGASLYVGDQSLAGWVDIVTFATDPGAILDLDARTDKVIADGYLPKGETLAYRMANEIHGRALDKFVLRVDAREIDNWGPVATPFPLDNTKVYGTVSVSERGRIHDGLYDFHSKDGSLKQGIPDKAGFWTSARIYTRNKLNVIAFSQHNPEGKAFEIENTYNDNDLKYGRKNFAPWSPYVNPSYADSYGEYLNAETERKLKGNKNE